MSDEWSAAELDIVNSYFNTNATILNIHAKLQRDGYYRTPDAIRNRIHIMRQNGGYERRRETTEKQLRIGYLDIEATNLSADFGVMLCWYIKVAGKNKYYHGLITEKELHKRIFDKRIVSDLLDAFVHFDVLYGHYASDRRFDLPYIRTRALMHGLGDKLARVQDERFIRDTWLIARTKLKLSSNRLDRLQKVLGVKAEKTPLEPATWIDAMYGDPKALKYVDRHCKADVDVLEQVHRKLEAVERKTYVRL